eukprot:CAMPEP_0168772292 /NCGR_PEP_ID=MMETSP0725-20121227/3881_1 /TAXON_ID=265536 /ORGANISM="Amphiprora sp., Strain CCMP467" /LENGTH=484 /DNA_ID=CAMNT_0008821805 /DNA_START=1 /DNA_END=1456 /DNA_ORIENTATION=-
MQGVASIASVASVASVADGVVLPVAIIRRVAREEGLSECYFNETSRVISFARAGESFERVRFNVYYTTGTVGTCLNHPRQGRTQLFRRNVRTLEDLREIFQKPRVHTGKGYQRRPIDSHSHQHCHEEGRSLSPLWITKNFPVGSRAYVRGYSNCTIQSGMDNGGKVKVLYDDGSSYRAKPTMLEEVMEEILDEETAAKQQLQSLEAERSQIDQQIQEAKGILNHFEEKRRLEEAKRLEKKRLAEEREEQEAKRQQVARLVAAIDSERAKRGTLFSGFVDQADFVSKQFDETVTVISTSGNATILLYEGGSWACTSGITKLLHNKLNGRQRTLPKATYVAIGSMDRYYIRFSDGKSEWVGCDGMTALLNKEERTVASIAFGEDWNSYFVVFTDGGWMYESIPQGLIDVIERRQRRGDLTCVSLGPNGEYYVAAKNGRSWWGGVSSKASKAIGNFGNRIRFMDFGDDYTSSSATRDVIVSHDNNDV